MDLMTALQLVLKKAAAHDGLAKGLREAAKAIEKHAAELCILAEDCDQPDYVKLVKGLCAEHNVHLIAVPASKTIGEWAGVCCRYFYFLFIFVCTGVAGKFCSWYKRQGQVRS
jgi:small subunit ribosomal protein S12e